MSEFICKCDCGGDVMGVRQFGRPWTCCTKCTPQVAVKLPRVKIEPRKIVVGAKHIARLQARADTLRVRLDRAADLSVMGDERAELKSLLWAIDELTRR